MLHHFIVKLISEVVDGISIKLNVGFFIDCFKSKFIKIAWSPQLLILKHVSDFVIAEDGILGELLLLSENLRAELLIIVKLLIILLSIARLSGAQAKLKTSFDKASIKNLRAKDNSRLVCCDSHGLNWYLELVLKILFQILICDVLRDLIENDRSLRLISSKQLRLLHFGDHLIVLVSSFDILSKECSSNASLQDKNRFRVLISHLDFRV